MYFSQQKEKHCSRHYDMYLKLIHTRGISILGEVRNVAISRPTQQLLWYKFHDFLAVFALAMEVSIDGERTCCQFFYFRN